jgi:hypothetical protein
MAILCWAAKNSLRGTKLKPENSQDYDQNPQRNCTFMNSASGFRCIAETRQIFAPQPSPGFQREGFAGKFRLYSRN